MSVCIQCVHSHGIRCADEEMFVGRTGRVNWPRHVTAAAVSVDES
eukprot:COSAG02_NODE_5311_length_4447_cov_38.707452_2_plen_45_part_00